MVSKLVICSNKSINFIRVCKDFISLEVEIQTIYEYKCLVILQEKPAGIALNLSYDHTNSR